jgi:hypothetical protein
MLTVEVLDSDKIPVIHNFTLLPARFDAYARGGPHTALIDVSGDNLQALRSWLGYYVIIRNGNNTAVWWGKVTDATTPVGGLAIGASFDEMFNRIKAIYSTIEGDNFSVGNETAWQEHAKSIATYGRKELLRTIGTANTTQADAAALTMATEAALIRQSIGLSAAPTALLRCEGLWKTLDWTYYQNLKGLVAYEGISSGEQVIGWGTTATDIGFADRMIHKLGGGLGQLNEGDQIRVTGSAGNSGVHGVAGGTGERKTYTASTISFAAGDDILDSAEGLGIVRMGTYIRVTGSSANSRAHLIDSIGRKEIATSTTRTGTITTEAAGPTITIEQSATLDLTWDVYIENPGPSITLVGPQKVAFSFTLPVTGSWTAGEIALQVRREGLPSDGLRAAIYSNGSGVPGTLLDSFILPESPKRASWITFPLSNTLTLTYGTTYWIVIERTGSNSTANYYAVSVDEDATGTFLVWDGSAWASKNGIVPHQVWGLTDTTAQISDILSAAQFISGVSVRADSDVPAHQYRDGKNTALAEIEALLDSGTAAGETVLATITSDWRAMVDVAPESTFAPFVLGLDGLLRTPAGALVEEGLLPVGQWCEVNGIDNGVGALAPVSPFLIGYMEYSGGKMSDIKAYGQSSIWDTPTLLQG